MYKFCGNMGEIKIFCVNRGICNLHHWLRGMDVPGDSDGGRGKRVTSEALIVSGTPSDLFWYWVS